MLVASSAKRKPLPEQRPRTVSGTSISPPFAFAAMRDARMTFAPNRSPSSSIGSPALRPGGKLHNDILTQLLSLVSSRDL